MARPFLQCPPDWIRGTLEPDLNLGLVVAVKTGTTPKTDVEEYWDGEVPWLTPKEIARRQTGIYVSETERCITRSAIANHSLEIHGPGTVFLTKRAPVGLVAVNTVPMTTNQGFLAFTCGPRLRPLFLAYWLLANTRYLDLVANGSTYPEIYVGDLFEFEISVPSLSEQDQILDVIAALQFARLLPVPAEQSITNLDSVRQLHDLNRKLDDVFARALPLPLSGKLARKANLASTDGADR